MLDILFGEGHAALHIFRVVTWLLLVGGAAYMTGQALANHWRPLIHVVAYSVLLTVADRFVVYALYFGDLWSPVGYLVDLTILTTIAFLTYRMVMARNMVEQYPWLCTRAGLFSWRESPTEQQ